MAASASVKDIENYLDMSMEVLEESVIQDCIDAGVLIAPAQGHDKKTKQDAEAQIADAIENDKSAIRQIICQQLNYCERIESDPVKTVISIVDTIVTGKITLLTTLPIPIVRIVVYAVRKKMLDPLCGCERA